MADHGGRLVAKALKSRGVEHLFTLSGGHLFSIYDGCKEEGIALVDVRHEQTAAFAAEGIAKATRRGGAAALDRAAAAPSGPTFVDYPLDVVFTEAEVDIPAVPGASEVQPAEGVEEA